MKRVVWKRACAAVQGRSHLIDQTPCQDSVATTYRRNVSAIALSDGAGSASHSQFGSEVCARTLCAILCRHFDEIWHMDQQNARCKIVSTLQGQLGCKAEELAVDVSALAATILAVAVKKNRYIAIHLGDGVIGAEVAASDGSHELVTLSAPENGEHSNETFFVTSGSAEAHVNVLLGSIRERDRGDITGFILMSDGPEAALYRKADRALAPACLKLLGSARGLKKTDYRHGLRGTLELIARSKTHDDCSIAIMARV